MKRFSTVSMMIILLVSTISISAMAEEPTRAQIAEVRQLFSRAELEIILEKKRSETATLQLEGCMKIEIDYDISVVDMASDGLWISNPFTKKVTPRGKGKIVREVCWFKSKSGYPSISEEAQREIEAGGGFLVADLWELNALETAKPDLSYGFPIVGLGSTWKDSAGDIFTPVISQHEVGLRWDSPDSKWHFSCRFVAVRR